jgi:hypothetical protein
VDERPRQRLRRRVERTMLEHGAMKDALKRIAEVEDVDSARRIAREVLETIPADPERPSL